ncbi:hypothetical protein MCAMS1_00813 [biofilm metagenome]
MQPLSMWENILLAAFAILLIFWMKPGIKAALERSKTAKSDWPGLVIPLALVILFIGILIAMVRSS